MSESVEHAMETSNLTEQPDAFDSKKASTPRATHSSSTVTTVMRTAISAIESLRVPKFLQRGDNPGDIPIVAGLEKVFFGTQPACETVTVFGIHPPRYLCYMLSGFLCDLIQFLIDLFLHVVLMLNDASLCWALGFGFSVYFRHTSHRYLVFGDYVGGYWQSLGRMYAAYSIIIVISTIFNIIMTRYAQLPHYVAWVITLLWTGIVNYFILKKLWSFGGKEKTDGPTSKQLQDLEMQDLYRQDGRLQARKVDIKR